MSDACELASGLVGAGSAAIGLVFVAVQRRLALRQAREAQQEQQMERLRLRKQATIDFAVSTSRPGMRYGPVCRTTWTIRCGSSG